MGKIIKELMMLKDTSEVGNEQVLVWGQGKEEQKKAVLENIKRYKKLLFDKKR